ncbi:hypothetical protein BU24DRAFT_410234 [Aaosphaeria arxii CBS 175.79]|uniref:Uncharacterized protein n=1 Tax=Aaosphaeria arxii CBS 175.79 TaxID=1450172 RepID=A0A6A5XNS4_9PLEO|nr:uncharacterized protein BU24DRAFT_410234 [Aaosphaeria arxii CBS 175.79]KAF2014497.1 hypothetical protein BU24DRAFT_410234 [Aaosphaeria arxii CBS 175.79]
MPVNRAKATQLLRRHLAEPVNICSVEASAAQVPSKGCASPGTVSSSYAAEYSSRYQIVVSLLRAGFAFLQYCALIGDSPSPHPAQNAIRQFARGTFLASITAPELRSVSLPIQDSCGSRHRTRLGSPTPSGTQRNLRAGFNLQFSFYFILRTPYNDSSKPSYQLDIPLSILDPSHRNRVSAVYGEVGT